MLKVTQGYGTVQEDISVSGFLETDGKLVSSTIDLKKGDRVFSVVEKGNMAPYALSSSIRKDNFITRVHGNVFADTAKLKLLQ